MNDVQQTLDDLNSLWRIRVFEDEVTRLRVEGSVVGSVHLCSGQEAIAVGACSVLNMDVDTVFSTYRGHGWALACGSRPDALMGELMGRATGTNGGRGGSAYLSDPDHGFFGENSIVGASAPIALGAALAARYDNSGRVAVTVFGDGAMNQGSVHEALNMASVLNAPLIFIVENNTYSELTPIASMVRDPELYKRAAAYGITASRIDGNDVGAVRASVHEAVEACRAGRGPNLIEAMTQRLVGHYIGDAQVYRTADELDRAKAEEPIVRQTALCRTVGASDDQISDAKNTARAEIADAIATARDSPPAFAASVREHLYA